MSRTRGLSLALLLLLVVGLFVARRTAVQRPYERLEEGAPPQAAGVASPGVTSGPAPSVTAIPLGEQPIATLAPKESDVRDEARANPHEPPRSLIRFAWEAGRRTEAAMANPGASSALLAELGDCVNGADLAQTAQAVCLRDAGRLAAKYPDLQPRFEQIRERAPEGVSRIVQRFEEMGR